MYTNHFSKAQIWYIAIRPKTLPASLAPILIGLAFAFSHGTFNMLLAIVSFLFALLLQIFSNLANDYYDFINGIDTPDRVGPLRVTANGLLSLKELKIGLIINILAICIIWIYLVTIAGWPLLFIGLFAIVCAYAYSGGPYPLASIGLGDVFVFIAFGLVAVTGTYYIQALGISLPLLIGSIPIGLLITAILVVNNFRDIENDKKSGKMTIEVLLGKKKTQYYYVLLLILSYLVSAYEILFLMNKSFYLMIVLVPTLPFAITLVKFIFSNRQGPELNKLLGLTSRFSLIFSFFYSAIVIL